MRPWLKLLQDIVKDLPTTLEFVIVSRDVPDPEVAGAVGDVDEVGTPAQGVDVLVCRQDTLTWE